MAYPAIPTPSLRAWDFAPGESVLGFEDHVLRTLVIAAILLEIIVFREPAPVDLVIVFTLCLGMFLGKLSFKAISTLGLASLTGFALANLISMHNPFDMERAVWYLAVTLYLVISWVFFVGVLSRYGLSFMGTLINAYCFAGLISAALGVGGYFRLLPDPDTLLLAGRAKGLFKDCNVYGPFFVPMALFSLVKILDTRNEMRAKLWASFLFLSAAIGMLLCFSRGCWLNFGVALVVFLAVQLVPANFNKENLLNFRVAGITVAAGVLTILVLINTAAVQNMLAMRITDSGLQGYDRVRFATQRESLEAAEEQPLGIGPGQAEITFGYATHSMYMRVLSENGVIALISLLVFIGATAARALQVARQTESPWLRNISLMVFASIIGHLANSFVIDTVHWRHIWFIYALPWVPFRFEEYSRRLMARTRRITNRKPLLMAP